MKPQYTKKSDVKLPDGKKVRVKSGTQLIDRFWNTLRAHLKHTNRVPGSQVLLRKRPPNSNTGVAALTCGRPPARCSGHCASSDAMQYRICAPRKKGKPAHRSDKHLLLLSQIHNFKREYSTFEHQHAESAVLSLKSRLWRLKVLYSP